MNTFKGALAEDLEVFYDARELASIREFEGVLLKVTERRWQSEMSGRLRDIHDGLHGEHLEISFRSEDFLRKRDKLPREKQLVIYGGKRYRVGRSQQEYGVCRLSMALFGGANRS